MNKAQNIRVKEFNSSSQIGALKMVLDWLDSNIIDDHVSLKIGGEVSVDILRFDFKKPIVTATVFYYWTG